MADFDPDSYLAQPPSGGGFDPDQYLKGFGEYSMQPAGFNAETAADVGKSAITGLTKGAIGLPGIPGSLVSMGKGIGDWINRKEVEYGLTTPEKIANFEASREKIAKTPPTSGDIVSGVENVTGKHFYEPKTVPGQYAETIGEFAPNAVGGPGSIAGRVAGRVVAPAVTSETAEQLTQGTALEPYARVAGALLPHGARDIRQSLTATPRNAPALEDLYQSAHNQYEAARNYGVEIRRSPVARMADDIYSDLHNDGFRQINVPKTWSAIEELKNPAGRFVTVSDLDSVRKALLKAGSNPMEGAEREAARRAISAIDNYVSALDKNPSHVAINPHFAGDLAETIRGARGDWAAMERSKLIEGKLESAADRAGSTYSGSNLDNATRQNIRQILNSPKLRRGFSDDEVAKMRQIVRGTAGGNIARRLGKLSPEGAVSGLVGVELGHLATGNFAGALGVPLVGKIAKIVGDRSTARKVQELSEMVRLRSPLGRSYPQPIPPGPVSLAPYARTGLVGQAASQEHEPLRPTVHPRISEEQGLALASGGTAAKPAWWLRAKKKRAEGGPATFDERFGFDDSAFQAAAERQRAGVKSYARNGVRWQADQRPRRDTDLLTPTPIAGFDEHMPEGGYDLQILRAAGGPIIGAKTQSEVALSQNAPGTAFRCGTCKYFEKGTCHNENPELKGRKVKPHWCCNLYDHPGMKVIPTRAERAAGGRAEGGPADDALDDSALAASMTHWPEKPNPAAPYLRDALNFARSGVTGVARGRGTEMPEWSNKVGDVLTNDAANTALGVMTPLKGAGALESALPAAKVAGEAGAEALPLLPTQPKRLRSGSREINPETLAEMHAAEAGRQSTVDEPDLEKIIAGMTPQQKAARVDEITQQIRATNDRALRSQLAGERMQIEMSMDGGGDSQPLLRDVTARGRSGRPIQSAPLPIGNEDAILQAGAGKAQSALPAAKVAGEAGAEATPSITAYHGSPHDFDRFDLSYNGTGEGINAYGRGIYAADNPEVAQSYRDRLAGTPVQTFDPHEDLAASYLKTAPTREDAISTLKQTAKDYQEFGHRGYAKNYEGAAKLLESGWETPVHPPGKMYQVAIKADPEHFLDWDKPLSEQSEHVRRSLPAPPEWYGAEWNPSDSGEAVLAALQNKVPSNQDVQSGVTEMLRSAGIPGIKYLDQGSRAGGEGTRNYVVFDDKMIDILKKYGLAGMIGAGAYHFRDSDLPQRSRGGRTPSKPAWWLKAKAKAAERKKVLA